MHGRSDPVRRQGRTQLAGAAIAVAVAALAAFAAPARADSIVFNRGGDVWIARPDGSRARQVTHDGSQAWAWPSESDGGKIAAAGPSTNSDYGSVNADLYVMDQRGHVANRIQTEADYSTLACFTIDPTHPRISPDGARIAYDINLCGTQPTVFWLPATARDFTAHSAQGLGQEGYGQPAWMGDGALLLNYGGVTPVPDQRQTFVSYGLGGQNSVAPWFDDDGNPGIWGEAVSRAGDEIAIVESDLNADGSASHVVLRIFSTTGPPAPPALRCEIALPPDGPLLNGWTGYYGDSSPSFSPDGRRIAFGEKDGVYVANSDCTGVHRVIADATQPYWSAADVGASSRGRLRVRLARVHRQRLRTLLRHGLRARATCSRRCRLSLELTVTAGTARRAHLISRRRYRRHEHARVTVGHAKRTLKGGRRTTVRIRLSRRARHRLRHTRRLTLRLRASARGGGRHDRASRTVRVRR